MKLNYKFYFVLVVPAETINLEASSKVKSR